MSILKEVIMSALIATPLGLTILIGIIYFIYLVAKEARKWRLARAEAFADDAEDAEYEAIDDDEEATYV